MAGAVALDAGSSPTPAPSFVRAKEEAEGVPTELVSRSYFGIYLKGVLLVVLERTTFPSLHLT